MATCNSLSKNDPLCGNYRYLSLNLEDLQIFKIVVLGQKWHFLPKILIFTFLLNWFFLTPKWFFLTPKCEIWIQNWIVKSLKESCEVFFPNEHFFKKFKKYNFTDFDTSFVLQINCSNIYRFSLPYGFAAIDCQHEIMQNSVTNEF